MTISKRACLALWFIVFASSGWAQTTSSSGDGTGTTTPGGAPSTPPSISAVAAGCSQTRYPPVAIRLTATGPTVLSFTVATDGSVKNVTVVKSSGNAELDDVAATCVAAKWHYKPATKDGQLIEVSHMAQVKWVVQGQ